jgi:hypothetical protein
MIKSSRKANPGSDQVVKGLVSAHELRRRRKHNLEICDIAWPSAGKADDRYSAALCDASDKLLSEFFDSAFVSGDAAGPDDKYGGSSTHGVLISLLRQGVQKDKKLPKGENHLQMSTTGAACGCIG